MSWAEIAFVIALALGTHMTAQGWALWRKGVIR